MSAHCEQVASLIKKSVQDVLTRGLSDPRVRGLLSVTEVKVSPDLANAGVWVSVLPAEHGPLSLKGLTHAASHIRSQVSRSVALRRMPRLTFHLDESLKKQADIHATINKAVQTLSTAAPADASHEHEDNSK